MGLTTLKLVESGVRQNLDVALLAEKLFSGLSVCPALRHDRDIDVIHMIEKFSCELSVCSHIRFRSQLNGSHGSYTMEDDHGKKPTSKPTSSQPKRQGKKATSKHKTHERGKSPRDHDKLVHDAIVASNLYQDASGKKFPDAPCNNAILGKDCAHKGRRGKWCSAHRRHVKSGGLGEVDPPLLEDPFSSDPKRNGKKDDPGVEDTYEEFLRRITMMDASATAALMKPQYLTRLLGELRAGGPNTIEYITGKLILMNARQTLANWGMMPRCECSSASCTFNCIPSLTLAVSNKQTFKDLLPFITSNTAHCLTSLNLTWTLEVYDELTLEIHDIATHHISSLSLQQLDGPVAINFVDLCNRRAWIGKAIGKPCCSRGCFPDCNYGNSLISLRRRDLEKTYTGPTVRPSDLTNKELHLDVVTSPALLGPSVVVAVVFSILLLFYDVIGVFHLSMISATLLLCLNVLSKTWYTVRPGIDITDEENDEVKRLITEEQAGKSNQIGNQQEKEDFQAPELRRVIIEDHTFLTQMYERSDGSSHEIPGWLLLIEKRSYGVACICLWLGLGFMFSFELNMIWIMISMFVLKFERSLREEKLICLNLFTSMTSHMVIRHGKSYDDFITCCDTLSRTFSKVPLPTVLSFWVPNCDSVPSMTRDVATLVFHHRKNVEARLTYLKALAPRYSGPFLGLLVMVTDFFLPLWHSLVPLLQWVGMGGLPIWNGYYLIQTVCPWPLTVFFLLMGVLISMAHAIHTLIPALRMVLCLEQFIVFADEFPTRILCLCGVSEDSHGGSCAVTLIRLGAMFCISMIGFCRRVTQSLSALYLSKCSNTSLPDNSGEFTTILDPVHVEDYLSRESLDDCVLYLDISTSSDDCLNEINSDDESSKSTPLLRRSNIPASSFHEQLTDELNSPRSSLDLS